MKTAKQFLTVLVLLLFTQLGFSQTDDHSLPGKYQSDMQFVQLISEGGGKFIAKFTGDCELTTQVGTLSAKGILEIPFIGENQAQTMYIQKTGNQIKIWNSDNSPMMQACNGATLAGIYMKRG